MLYIIADMFTHVLIPNLSKSIIKLGLYNDWGAFIVKNAPYTHLNQYNSAQAQYFSSLFTFLNRYRVDLQYCSKS